MSINDQLRTLRRNLVLIISFSVIGASAGALVALTTPTRYTSSIELFVAAQSSAGATASDLNMGRSYAQQAVTSYISLIPSAIVLQPVIEDLGLTATPSELGRAITAQAAPLSAAITVSVTHANPGQAARIANAIGESFSTVVAERLERPAADRPSLVRIETLQPASVPLSPSAPDVSLNVLAGSLLGLVLGIGAAVTRATLDTRVRSVEDVERITDLPTLGRFFFDASAPERPLVVASEPRSTQAEAFRAFRTNVRFLGNGVGQSIVITSAGPGEGKSTTAANLALAFAESGDRVALVDADLRLPRVADYFGIEGNVGLADVLAGSVLPSDVMQRWGRGAMFLLPAGALPPNPAELLGSATMAKLVDQLVATFDIVIFDAPPMIVTDAAVLSRHTGGAVVVVAAAKTTQPRLEAALAGIESAGGKARGSVVTMLPVSGADRSAYGAYGAHGEAAMATTT